MVDYSYYRWEQNVYRFLLSVHQEMRMSRVSWCYDADIA